MTRAISGHATATMQEHYSTARDHEVVNGLAKVIDFAKVRESLVEPKPLRRQRRRVNRRPIDVNEKRITANG